jgi:hypothetical protein
MYDLEQAVERAENEVFKLRKELRQNPDDINVRVQLRLAEIVLQAGIKAFYNARCQMREV